MDARGFDTDRARGAYRPITLGRPDAFVLIAGLAVAAGVLAAWVL